MDKKVCCGRSSLIARAMKTIHIGFIQFTAKMNILTLPEMEGFLVLARPQH